MSGQDTKPTPVSGMPAVVASSVAVQPSEGEIAAPKSEILEALAAIRAELGEARAEVSETRAESKQRGKETAARLARLEEKTDHHAKALGRLTNEVTAHGRQLGELASAQVSTARAASAAAEIAAQALAKANTAQDDTRKMVESAMAIQRGAIEAAVRVAVQPILEDVEQQGKAIGAVVDELGIEDRVALGRKSLPGEARPETALKKIDKRAQRSTLVQLVIAIGVIVNALWQLLSGGHP